MLSIHIYNIRCIRTIAIAAVALFFTFTSASAQIGSYRNDFAIGFNGGYALSSIGFTPKVTQSMHGGVTGGLSLRYTGEKYFNTYCSVAAEVNYARVGWKERILTVNDQPVINATTGLAEAYQRNLNYIQVPIFAHLAWGKERKGFQFFINLGPQFGFLLSESTTTNFTVENANFTDRSNSTCAQDTMAVENKFDYGIAAGLGIEWAVPRVGHFLLEGRYYYGLGNIYGDSKRDYFAKSNHTNIVVKLTYLFDIVRTKR